MHEHWCKFEVIKKDASIREVNSVLGKIEDAVQENNSYDYVDVYPARSTGKHFPDKKAAEEYLRTMDICGSYYSYFCTFDVKRSSTYITLEKRLLTEKEKLEKYSREHSVKAFKSALVGCPKCTSKLAIKYLKDDYCPLCGKDLRSKTTLDTIARYEKNISQLQKELRNEEKNMASAKTMSKNTAVYTLVAAHVDGHC